MKKLVLVFAILSAFAFGQSTTTAPTKAPHFGGGMYYAPTYNYRTTVYTSASPTASGTYSITVFKPTVTLADGHQAQVYSTTVPILIGSGANQETVTPTTVSGCGVGQPTGGCTITATFSNGHGPGDIIQSSTSGWAEAVYDAGQHGGGDVYWEIDCGNITLSTSGATTTTTCNIPKTTVALGASVFVTTTVTTAASYSLGISGHTTAFMTSCTALTAATTCSQFIASPTTLAAGTGTGAVLVTANATAGAGVIHIKLWGYTGAQSNF